MNCGQRATQRLQDFNSGAASVSAGNVLDLKQTTPAQTEHHQPTIPTSPPAKSLHGMHARNLHAQGQSRQVTNTSAASNVSLSQETGSDTPATMDGLGTGDDGAAARNELSRQFEAAAQAATVTPDTNPHVQAPTAGTAPQQTAEVTHMQPHQVYPLKSDTPTQQASAADMPRDNSPRIEDYEMPPIETASQNPDQTIRKRPGIRKLLPANWMNATARAGAAGLCILLLAGYVTYLNYPNIAVRVAASRANVNASLPEYVPDGYDFNGPVAYSDGQLTLTFKSQDDTISLVQSQTQWDSRSLLTNYINRRTSDYEIYRQNGLTIYTYDNRHAAWVNGGTMYTIDSETYLSEQDIVNMASSL